MDTIEKESLVGSIGEKARGLIMGTRDKKSHNLLRLRLILYDGAEGRT
jgi:hypothetical protein